MRHGKREERRLKMQRKKDAQENKGIKVRGRQGEEERQKLTCIYIVTPQSN